MLKKTNTIIATAVLVGSLSVGGTAYAVGNKIKTHKQAVNNAKQEIKYEESSLKSYNKSISKMVDKNGFLTSSASHSKLEQYKKKINRMPDSYTDFNIHRDELKGQIKVVKLNKKSSLSKLNKVEKKITAENKVNGLFTKSAIVHTSVSKPSIKDKVTQSQINSVYDKYVKQVKENTKWYNSIKSTLSEASNQVKQINTAKSEVSKVYKNGKVVNGVSRSSYNKALKESNKVKNTTIKNQLKSDLDKVLKVVQENEKKAAEAKAKKVKRTDVQLNNSSGANASSGSTALNGSSNYNGSSNSGASNHGSSGNTGSYSGGTSSGHVTSGSSSHSSGGSATNHYSSSNQNSGSSSTRHYSSGNSSSYNHSSSSNHSSYSNGGSHHSSGGSGSKSYTPKDAKKIREGVVGGSGGDRTFEQWGGRITDPSVFDGTD